MRDREQAGPAWEECLTEESVRAFLTGKGDLQDLRHLEACDSCREFLDATLRLETEKGRWHRACAKLLALDGTDPSALARAVKFDERSPLSDLFEEADGIVLQLQSCREAGAVRLGELTDRAREAATTSRLRVPWCHEAPGQVWRLRDVLGWKAGEGGSLPPRQGPSCPILILRVEESEIEVAPIHFEARMAASDDLAIEDGVPLGLPLVVEVWNSLVVPSDMLERPYGRVSDSSLERVMSLRRELLRGAIASTIVEPDDPRVEFRARQIEKLGSFRACASRLLASKPVESCHEPAFVSLFLEARKHVDWKGLPQSQQTGPFNLLAELAMNILEKPGEPLDFLEQRLRAEPSCDCVMGAVFSALLLDRRCRRRLRALVHDDVASSPTLAQQFVGIDALWDLMISWEAAPDQGVTQWLPLLAEAHVRREAQGFLEGLCGAVERGFVVEDLLWFPAFGSLILGGRVDRFLALSAVPALASGGSAWSRLFRAARNVMIGAVEEGIAEGLVAAADVESLLGSPWIPPLLAGLVDSPSDPDFSSAVVAGVKRAARQLIDRGDSHSRYVAYRILGSFASRGHVDEDLCNLSSAVAQNVREVLSAEGPSRMDAHRALQRRFSGFEGGVARELSTPLFQGVFSVAVAGAQQGIRLFAGN